MKTRKNNSTSPQFFLCVFTVRANPIPPPVSPLTLSLSLTNTAHGHPVVKGM